jgi:hypothetical protein
MTANTKQMKTLIEEIMCDVADLPYNSCAHGVDVMHVNTSQLEAILTAHLARVCGELELLRNDNDALLKQRDENHGHMIKQSREITSLRQQNEAYREAITRATSIDQIPQRVREILETALATQEAPCS